MRAFEVGSPKELFTVKVPGGFRLRLRRHGRRQALPGQLAHRRRSHAHHRRPQLAAKVEEAMSLNPGTHLGPYEILSPLGAGGMGEVYKARDTRLDRFVAVKVLPEHIAKREDLRQRFEREARAVASLNHPHICVLHDIGNQDGTGYMVMEHLEGETLAARIARGALPFDQALQLATQIADALDRAHRAGVTHRDVKPANVMLTRDGVKVLDFGLAKSGSKPAPTEQTLTAALTTEGSVLGTPQYMAPEQFEGKEADTRSDIWAFGAVLYEMVTGEKAFQGKSYSSLVGAILSADPRPMSVKPFTPPALERLVRRCLAKEPEDRYQSMRDVVLDLRMPPQETAAMPARTSRWPWAVAAVCLVVAALAVGWGAWMRKSSEPALPVKSRCESAGGKPVRLDRQRGRVGHFARRADAGLRGHECEGRDVAAMCARWNRWRRERCRGRKRRGGHSGRRTASRWHLWPEAS